MKTKCPCCGATNSLETLIAFDDARNVLSFLLKVDQRLTRPLVRYIALFRPEKTDLSWSRTIKLLTELVPDIQAQKITRNGQLFDAPVTAWLWAIEQIFTKQNLKRPLKGHGLLYEIICGWRGQGYSEQLMVDDSTKTPQSKTLNGIEQLELRKRQLLQGAQGVNDE